MKTLLLGTLVSGLLAGILLSCSAQDHSAVSDGARSGHTVRTTSGTVSAAMGPEGAHVFRDIPFALPPNGDRRWQAPVEFEHADAIVEPFAEPVMCPQPQSQASGQNKGEDDYLGTEDCLYLDIYAPDGQKESARWPVMVWVHGGSNLTGHKGTYDFARLAARQQVVVVVINYRLGPLGWFSHPALNGSALDAPALANFGTLDIIEALRWTQRNITDFGGDAANVTLFGESAGGRNVFSLLASPMAEGLFHRAIAQSGHVRSVTRDQAHNAQRQYPRVSRGSWEVAEALALDNDTVSAETLRGVSAPALLKSYFELSEGHIQPAVIADGVVIPEMGLQAALADPRYAKNIPVMAGTNRDEITLWIGLNRYFIDVSYPFSKLFPAKLRVKDPDLYGFWADMRSRGWKLSAVDVPLSAMQAAGYEDLYAYRYDWDEQADNYLVPFSTILGATHASEIAFIMGAPMFGVIGDYMYPDSESAQEMTEVMMSAWGSFAREGAPRLPNEIDWPRYDASQPAFMTLDSGDALTLSDDVPTLAALLEQVARSQVVSELERCLLVWELLTAVGTPDYDAYSAWESGYCAAIDAPQEQRVIREALEAEYGSVYYPE